jgi:hypothetical protein
VGYEKKNLQPCLGTSRPRDPGVTRSPSLQVDPLEVPSRPILEAEPRGFEPAAQRNTGSDDFVVTMNPTAEELITGRGTDGLAQKEVERQPR